MFGLLMQDNTPVDWRYRGMSYVPGGPYYPRGARLGFVPGGPYYPGLGYVPGGPYYRRFRGYGIPPGQAARVPQYGDHHPHEVPGVPHGFGGDDFGFGPGGSGYVIGAGGGATPETQESTGWSSQDTVDVIKSVLDATGKVIGAVTTTGQTYYHGSCGPNMVFVPQQGRCVATSGGSGGGSNTMLIAGAVGLGILALVLSRRG
jgi:hypothetical protein